MVAAVDAAIGFVGLGAMGGAIARRLLASSVDLTIYARRDEVRHEFESLGAGSVPSLSELGAACDVVFVCVFSEDQLVDLATGDDGLLAAMGPGSILVSHTTGSPDTVRMLAQAGAARGVDVVDAPVSGDPAHVESGRLTVILGGSSDAVSRCRPTMELYANNVVPVGPVGAAMAVKLINNLLMAANLQLAQQAILLGEALGADLEALRAIIPVSSGRSYAFEVAADFASVDRLQELAGPYLRKDIDTATSVLERIGVDPGVLRLAAESGPLRYEAP